jgi:hypothetical protein
MTFTDAAAEILKQLGRPLHYKEITDLAIERNLLSHVGKSPEVTMHARLAALVKKESADCPLVRVKPGIFALREWDEATIRDGLDPKKGAKRTRDTSARASERPAPTPVIEEQEVEAEENASVEAAADDESDAADEPAPDSDDEVLIPVRGKANDRGAKAPADRPAPVAPQAPAERPAREPRVAAAAKPKVAVDEDEEPIVEAPEDRMRAELLTSAAEVFDEEEDDDQPILGGAGDARTADAGEGGDGRRRRRRRRRGRSAAEPGGGGGLPTYTATPVTDAAMPQVHASRMPSPEPNQESSVALDELAGRDFADAVVQLFSGFDRNGGPVSLRQLADAAQRRGRLQGEPQLIQSMLAAAVRADNQRRVAAGQRPRFRFAGGRIGLTDWVLGHELVALENEALAAIERYREAARRALAKRIADLPGHAIVELVLLVLERAGASQIRAVRRAGLPGGETHFTAQLRSAAGDLKVAIVVRRDGREIGRERVTELRGSLHHYGPATMGWILTTGQVLSGAREEASSAGVAPMVLTDGAGLARLCEENDVAVVRARLPIALPDVDLLEALRAS